MENKTMNTAANEWSIYHNEEHLQQFFNDFGGEEHIKGKYSSLHNSISQNKVQLRMQKAVQEHDGKDNTLILSPPRVADHTVADDKQVIHTDILFHFADSVYTCLKGTIKKVDTDEEIHSFIKEFDLTQGDDTNDYEHGIMLDIPKMEESEYYIEASCVGVKKNGTIQYLSGKLSTGQVLAGVKAAPKNIKVKKPVYQIPGKVTGDMIVLYGRDGAEGTYDFRYADNVKSNGFVKTMLPFKVKFKVNDNYEIQDIKQETMKDQFEFYVEMIHSGDDNPVATYTISKEDVIANSELSGKQKAIHFTFDEDWNCKLPISAYGAGTKMTLKAMFLLPVKNLITRQIVPVQFMVTSTSDYTKKLFECDGQMGYIPMLDIRWGCLGKDSRIKMADGSEKLVSEVQIGDTIKNGSGGDSEVTNVLKGHEETLIRIELMDGRELLLTDTHPVSTDNGMIRAKDVKVDDTLLLNEDEKMQVRFSHKEFYDDKVYSLVLATSSTIVANGFIVGDYALQNAKLNCDIKANPVISEEVNDLVFQMKQLVRDANHN